MKECKKEKIEYKKEALMAIAPVLEAHELDRFQELYELLFPLLDKVSAQQATGFHDLGFRP